MSQPRRLVKSVAITVSVSLAACGGGPGRDRPPATDSPVAGQTDDRVPETPRSAPPADRVEAIPQPMVRGLPVAPDEQRIDLALPTFSNPTLVNNPMFPVRHQESVLLLGRVDDRPFRTEVTLLPESRVIDWQGQRIEALVSQYVAFLGARLHEVAYDYYAQADDGSVWYLGEDVFNFADGRIVDTHGSWLAGRDGPGAMIMPARPRVGDVYRPENIPGLVFEEVTVRSVGRPVVSPVGATIPSLEIEELHMDGSTETKLFGEGYGEFRTAAGGDLEAVALSVPADGLPGPVPSRLASLQRDAIRAFEASVSGDWNAVASLAVRMTRMWAEHQGRAVEPVGRQLENGLEALASQGRRQAAMPAARAAIDVARSVLDLELRHRPPAEIDVGRLALWAATIELDASTAREDLVGGDLFALDYVRDRIAAAIEADARYQLNVTLEQLAESFAERDFDGVRELGRHLRALSAGWAVEPAGGN